MTYVIQTCERFNDLPNYGKRFAIKQIVWTVCHFEIGQFYLLQVNLWKETYLDICEDFFALFDVYSCKRVELEKYWTDGKGVYYFNPKGK
jgi:hypothetical protein